MHTSLFTAAAAHSTHARACCIQWSRPGEEKSGKKKDRIQDKLGAPVPPPAANLMSKTTRLNEAYNSGLIHGHPSDHVRRDLVAWQEALSVEVSLRLS